MPTLMSSCITLTSPTLSTMSCSVAFAELYTLAASHCLCSIRRRVALEEHTSTQTTAFTTTTTSTTPAFSPT
jgi:hypothetical protein